VGRVSGWAWAAGYAGGLASLGLCYPLIVSELAGPAGLSAAAIVERKLSFLVVAAFYLVFALPAFLWLRESRPQGTPLPLTGYVLAGWRRVAATIGHLRRHREVAKFIAASFFFTDGISTVIAFSAIYATGTFDFTSAELLRLFLVLNVVAVPGALVAGYAADRLGPKHTLGLTLLLWIGVVLAAFLARTKTEFWIMAAGAAVGMGSTQAVGRSFMSQLSPKARAAEFFGFYVQSGKLSSMFGHLIFGAVSVASGSQRLAVLSLLPLFLVGLLLLLLVNEQRGLSQAGETPAA
jgi:UMF1 family MFS transporter